MLLHYRGEILYCGHRGEEVGAHYDIDAESVEAARVLLEERLIHKSASPQDATWFRITRDGVEEVAYRLGGH